VNDDMNESKKSLGHSAAAASLLLAWSDDSSSSEQHIRMHWLVDEANRKQEANNATTASSASNSR
jgi:hypothetical protein